MACSITNRPSSTATSTRYGMRYEGDINTESSIQGTVGHSAFSGLAVVRPSKADFPTVPCILLREKCLKIVTFFGNSRKVSKNSNMFLEVPEKCLKIVTFFGNSESVSKNSTIFLTQKVFPIKESVVPYFIWKIYR
jgi:putative transposon-encoded protein